MTDQVRHEVDCVTGKVTEIPLTDVEIGLRADAGKKDEALHRAAADQQAARQSALTVLRQRAAKDDAFAALLAVLGVQ